MTTKLHTDLNHVLFQHSLAAASDREKSEMVLLLLPSPTCLTSPKLHLGGIKKRWKTFSAFHRSFYIFFEFSCRKIHVLIHITVLICLLFLIPFLDAIQYFPIFTFSTSGSSCTHWWWLWAYVIAINTYNKPE